MIKRFSKSSFDDLVLGAFSALKFTNCSIRFKSEKMSRAALADLCSLLWPKLKWHSSVIDGKYQLAPSCTWSSLSYRDLNCLVRVLLYDFCNLYFPDYHFSHISVAYFDTLISSPFATFLRIPRIDKDVKIKSRTIYEFEGSEYSSMSDLLDVVYERFPLSKYNVNLIF